MRVLPAICNRARKTNRELPDDNPADIVDCSRRRDGGMRSADRPAGTESGVMSKRPTGIERYDHPAGGWGALKAVTESRSTTSIPKALRLPIIPFPRACAAPA
jgi:hypothetical protein